MNIIKYILKNLLLVFFCISSSCWALHPGIALAGTAATAAASGAAIYKKHQNDQALDLKHQRINMAKWVTCGLTVTLLVNFLLKRQTPAALVRRSLAKMHDSSHHFLLAPEQKSLTARHKTIQEIVQRKTREDQEKYRYAYSDLSDLLQENQKALEFAKKAQNELGQSATDQKILAEAVKAQDQAEEDIKRIEGWLRLIKTADPSLKNISLDQLRVEKLAE